MSSSDPGYPQPLKCTDARFVEVEFPRQLRPRLVIEFSEGLSLLLEDRDAVPLAADFIAAFRDHLAAKGGRPC
ncbi:hypothetical protein HZ994_12230 [Akkermansiaceae bacterium]|nr:hypothetical protein HZ994_12230 [Akkermansiaceae bacterium]